MLLNKTISLVMPCYNEAVGLDEMLRNKPPFIDEVIIVDNASTDETAEVAKKYLAKIIYEEKRGYGSAYQAGLPKAQGDVIVTMDADCTYPLTEIENMLKYMIEGDYDFVSGCRFPLKNASSMPITSRIGNALTIRLMQNLFRMKIKDFMTGMWLIRKDIVPAIMPTDPSMAFSLEIKINAWNHPKVKFGEFHISYYERVGDSKFNRVQDSLKTLQLITKIKIKTRD